MNTVARRDALIRRLRRGATATIEELRDHVGASRRTLIRDLNVLRKQGYTIDSQPGLGGGVRLDPTSVFIDAQFTPEEVVALIIALAVAKSIASMPFAPLAHQALAKIERSMPSARVRELRRLLDRVVIVDAATTAVHSLSKEGDSQALLVFEAAFTRRVLMEFDYVDRLGRGTARTVEPEALLVRVPYWYIVAWDTHKNEVRSFRMDRIRNSTLLAGRTFRPRALANVLRQCPMTNDGRE